MEWGISAICVLALALTSGLKVNGLRVSGNKHVDNICSLWGNFHVKTFDGDVFQFQGTCEYNLVSDCHRPVQSFSVHVKRAQIPKNPQIIRVLVTIGDLNIAFTKKLIMVNSDIVKLPHNVPGVILHENSVYVKLYAKLGLSVTWDRDDAVTLELHSKYANRTCGLCGDFNGVPIYNEFLSDGREMDITEFGNKYRIHNPNDDCEDPYEGSEANTLTKCQLFREDCTELLENERWSSCMNVLSPEPYIQACMLDMCSRPPGDIEDIMNPCSTLSEYSRQCSHAGGSPPNWRTSTFCAVNCPFNMEYSESGSPCVDTCTHVDTSLLCEEHKMDGCFCPPGTVFDDISDRGCIPQDQCQCKHNNVYNSGEVLVKDDEECVCQHGRWICETLNLPGVCALEEGSHFTTFDGKEFTFHGNCYYFLSKDCVDSKFIILAQLAPCVARHTDTCLKSVVLILNNDKSNSLIIKDDGIVRHNGELTFPYTTDEFTIFKPSSFHIMLQTTFGLQIQIQLVPLMQLYISLDQTFQDKTCGLCGNLNKVLSDELMTSQGLVEGTATSFGNSWKAQSNCPDYTESLVDPCSFSIDNENYAEHWCSKLKEKEGAFAKCHSSVNPESYYKRCKYSSCTCDKSEDCLCAVFSSYIRACTAKGVFLQNWRSHTVCEKYTESCPASQTFNYNIQQCQHTCDSLSLERQSCSIDYIPVDGCVCPEGLYESENGICVPMDKCPCYYNGKHIHPGRSINIKNEHCICTNGKLQCLSWKTLVNDCPAPKVFFNCSTADSNEQGLGCEQTCAQKNLDCFFTGCESGCQCPSGLFDDGRGYCVKEHDCPCKHDSHFYASGSQITDQCNKCICQSGMWNCTMKTCPSTCTIYGSGHYITFDQQRFGFSGECSYIAVQNKCGNKTGTFHVITENIPCGTTGTTCSKVVRILLGITELELRDGQIIEHKNASDLSIKYKVRSVGLYLVIETAIGLTVLWDRKTTVRIILQPQHMGEVCGLCGNYNENGQDDFTTQGLLHVSDVLEFVNSWKVNSLCPDAQPDFDSCLKRPNRHTWAQLQCSIIKSDTFKACHNKVEWTPYFDNCVKDSCSCDTGGDCECFCTAVAAYAQACNEAGVCVAWRTPEICPVFCDYFNHRNECTWHYSPCHTPCYKTCLNPNGTCTNPLPNVEGCYPTCPEDKPIFDENIQICVEKCEGCVIKGEVYKPGEPIPSEKPCTLCYCGENGTEICFQKDGCCFYNGTQYNDTDVIYNVTDGMGTCYYAICINTTVYNSSYPCPIISTTPMTTETSLTTKITSQSTAGPSSTTQTPQSTTPLIETSTSFVSTSAETRSSGPSTTTTTMTTKSSTTTKPSTFSPTPTEPCIIKCDWSDWFNVYNPEKTGDDLETYENIKASGKEICEHPEDIECRSVLYPNLSLEEFLEETQQVLQCNVSFGLVCEKIKQIALPFKCYDYQIKVNCCKCEPVSISPTPITLSTTNPTSTPVVISTTTPVSITTTKASTASQTGSTSTSRTTTKATTTPVKSTTPVSSTTTKASTTSHTEPTSTSGTTIKAKTTPEKSTTPVSSTATKASTTSQTGSTSTSGTTTKSTTTPVKSTTPVSSTTTKASTTSHTEPTSTSGTTTKGTTTPEKSTTPVSSTTTKASTTSQTGSTSTSGTTTKSTTTPVKSSTPVSSTATKASTTSQTGSTSTSGTTTKSTTTPVKSTTPVSSTTTKVSTTSQTGSISTTGTTTNTTTTPVKSTTPISSTTTKASTTSQTVSTSTSGTTSKTTASPEKSTTPVSSTTTKASTTSHTEPTSTSRTTTKATTTPVKSTIPVSSTTTKASTTSHTEPTSTSGTTIKATTTPEKSTTHVSSTATKASTTSQTGSTSTSRTTTKATTTPVKSTTPVSSTTTKSSTTSHTEPTSTSGTTTNTTTTPVKSTTPVSSTTTKPSTTSQTGSASTSRTTTKSTTTPVKSTTPVSSTTTKASTTSQTGSTSTSGTTTKATTTPVKSTTPVLSTTTKASTTSQTGSTSTSRTTTKSTTTPVKSTTPVSSTTTKASTTSQTGSISTSGTTTKSTTTPVKSTTLVSSTATKASTTSYTERTSTSGKTTKSTTTPVKSTTPVSSTTTKSSTTSHTEPTSTSGTTTKSTTTLVKSTTLVSSTTTKASTTSQTGSTSTSRTTTKSTTTPVKSTTPVSSTTTKASTTSQTGSISTSGTTTKSTTTPVKSTTLVSSTATKASTTSHTEPTSTSGKTTKSTTTPVKSTTPVSSTTTKSSTTSHTEPTSTSGTTTKSTTTPVKSTTLVSSTTTKASTTSQTGSTSTSGTTTKATTTPVKSTTPVSSTTTKASTTSQTGSTSTSRTTTKSTTTPVKSSTPVSSTTTKASTTSHTEPTSTSGTTTKGTTTPEKSTTPVSSTTTKASTTSQTGSTSTSRTTTKSTTTPVKSSTPVSSTTTKASTTSHTEPTSTSGTTTKGTTTPEKSTTPVSSTTTKASTTSQTGSTSTSRTTTKSTTTPVKSSTPVSSTTTKASTTSHTEPTSTSGTTTKGTTTPEKSTTPVSSTTTKASTTSQTGSTSTSRTTTKSTTTPVKSSTPVSSTTTKASTTSHTEPTSTSGTTTKGTTTPEKSTTPVSSTTTKASTTSQTGSTSTSRTTTKSTTTPVKSSTPVSSTTTKASTTSHTEPTSTSGTTTKGTTTPEKSTTPVSSTTTKASTTSHTEPTSTSGTTTKSTTTPVKSTTPISSTTTKASTTSQTVSTSTSGTTTKSTTTPVKSTTPISSTTTKASTTSQTVSTSTSGTTTKGTTTPEKSTTPVSSTTTKASTTSQTGSTSTSRTTTKSTTTPVKSSTPVSSTTTKASTTSHTEPTSTSGTTTKGTTTPEKSTTPVSSTTTKASTTSHTEPTSTSGTTIKATTTPVKSTTPISSTTTKASTTSQTGSTSTSGTTTKATTTPVKSTTPISSTTTKASTTSQTGSTSTSRTTTKSTTTPVKSSTPVSSTTTKASTTSHTEPTSTSGTTTKGTTTPEKSTTPVSSTTTKASTTSQTGSTSTSRTTTKSTTTPVKSSTPVSSTTTKASTTSHTEPTSTSGTTTKGTTTPEKSTTPVSSTTTKASTTSQTEPTSTSGTTTKGTTTPEKSTTPVSSTTTKASTTSQTGSTSTSRTTTKSTTTPVKSSTPVSSTTTKASTTSHTEPTSTSGTTTKGTTTPEKSTTPVSSTTTKASTTSHTEPTSTSGTTTKGTTTPEKSTTPVSSTTTKASTTSHTEPTSTSGTTTKSTTTPVKSTTPTSSTTTKASTTSQTVSTTTSGTTTKSTTTPVKSTTPISSTTTKASTTSQTEPTSTSGTTTKGTTTPEKSTTPVSSTTTKASTTSQTGSTSTSRTTTKSTTTPVKSSTPVSSTTTKASTTSHTEPTSTNGTTIKATTTPVKTPSTTPVSSTITERRTTSETEPTSRSGTTTNATHSPVVTSETSPSPSTETEYSVITGTETTRTVMTISQDLVTSSAPVTTSTMSLQTVTFTSTESSTTHKPLTTFTTAKSATTKPTTTPVKSSTESVIPTTTECFCIFNKTHYKPGETIFENIYIGSGICLTMECSNSCIIQNTTNPCPTPTQPPSTTTPGKHCPEWGVTENETFVLCNCTVARCIENYTVEIIPYKCPPLQNITCSNGQMPVKVPDEYHCCEQHACDCLCQGWGDPHYKTFDGLFYSYQGECKYVLMEEIRPKHNLKIYIDNVKCDPTISVSCPRAIIVSFKNTVITLKNHNLIGAVKLEALKGDSPLQLPFSENGLRVTSSKLNLVLEIEALKAVVKFGANGFSVYLPFVEFGNNTQGHCGTCNNNQADDCMLPGGTLVNDCEVMANYWIAKDLYNPECKPPAELSDAITPIKPSCPSNTVCELLKSDLFKECHTHLSPENYLTGCQFDSCHMSNPAVVCVSLQTYAMACLQLGICINWRNYTDLCSVQCPSDKVYQACGPADPRSCKDKTEDHFMNVTTEGCFCPDGKLLYNKQSGLCVEKCGCLDPSGKSREFGENFEYGCQNCVCDEASENIICNPKQCVHNNNELTCRDPGFVVVNVTDPKDACCTINVCRCESSTCPSVNDQCKTGYIPVLKVPKGKCCPELTCEPKKVCVHEGLEYEPGMSLPVVDCQKCHCTSTVEPISQLYEVQCTFVTCSVDCEPGYGYVESSTEECCGKCVKNKCVLNYNGKVYLLKNGEEWSPSDDACNKFTCTKIYEEFVIINYKIHCPPFNISNCQPGTVQLSANRCCNVCVEKDMGCQVQVTNEFINHNNCQSVEKVTQTHCQGHCNSYSKYTELHNSSCSCCQASRNVTRTVTLNCLNGDSIDYTYSQVEACSCDQTKCFRNDQETHSQIRDFRHRRNARNSLP